jgi:hypothetical protein
MVNADQASAGEKTEANRIEAERDFALGSWQQSLRISRIGSTLYFDQGNGVFVRKVGTKE